MAPRISVVMSVYNGERYLRQSVDSILGQTFTDFEFIIIDDGSADNSWNILSGYNDKRIRLLQNDTNLGLTRSLNKGLDLARGKYIARQDADDISLPPRFAMQVALLDRQPCTVVVGSSVEYIDQKGQALRKAIRSQSPHYNRWRLLFGNCIAHSSAMFRRKTALSAGGYDESLRYSQDYDLWERLSTTGDIMQSSDILLRWRRLESGISSANNIKQRKIGNTVIQRMLKQQFGREVSLIEVSFFRNLARLPLESERQVKHATRLLFEVWCDFKQKWKPEIADVKLIKKDIATRLSKAGYLQKSCTPGYRRVLLIKSLSFNPGQCFRRSFWKTLLNPNVA